MSGVKTVARKDFEKLVRQALEQQGFKVEVNPKAADVGVDLTAFHEARNERLVIRLKYQGGKPLPGSVVLRDAWDLRAAQEYLAGTHAVLVTDGTPTQLARELAEKAGVSLVDRVMLAVIAKAAPPQVDSSSQRKADTPTQSPNGEHPTDAGASSSSQAEKPRHEQLREQLVTTPCGFESFRQFEEVGAEIISFLFRPHLGAPRVQTVSDDALDRRDAVYKIGHGSVFWDSVKTECRTRFLVAEFKNSCESPNQTDVESLAQYLWGDGLRSFGLLCTRKPPSASAVKARRRAWTKDKVLIVFLDDSDLLEMLALKGNSDDPSALLDTKIDDFLSAVNA